MRRETVDIVEELIGQIDRTFKIKEVIDNGGGSYTLNTCDTMYLQVCKEVEIDGNTYKITDIVQGESITIEGSVLPGASEFEIYAPNYFHGTVISVAEEYNAIQHYADKLPMIYLVEPFRETSYEMASGNVLDREAAIKLFFIGESSWADKTTDGHYEDAIIPMNNLRNRFLQTLRDSVQIDTFEDWDSVNRAKFARLNSKKGGGSTLQSYETSYIDDDLTGSELNMNLPILRGAWCQCNCKC